MFLFDKVTKVEKRTIKQVHEDTMADTEKSVTADADGNFQGKIEQLMKVGLSRIIVQLRTVINVGLGVLNCIKS